MTSPYGLFDNLASFWQTQGEADVLRQHLHGSLLTWVNAFQRLEHVKAAVSPDTATPTATCRWYPLELRQSMMVSLPQSAVYGGGSVYGDGLTYGGSTETFYAWPLPAEVVGFAGVVDRILAPSWWLDAANAFIQDQQIVFRSNPFATLPASAEVDPKLEVFLRQVELDLRTPTLRWGWLIGYDGPSDDLGLSFLQSAWDGLLRGLSLGDLWRMASAVCGLPVVKGGETVEAIYNLTSGIWIQTDKNVYGVHPQSTVLVTVGQVLQPLQALTDTLLLIDGATGRGRQYLPLLPGLLIDGISWPNTDTSWQYVDGDARCSLQGDPQVIEAYWQSVHAQGLAEGSTLAQRLGVTATSTTGVNPMSFIWDTIWGGSTTLLVVRPELLRGQHQQAFSAISDDLPVSARVQFYHRLQPLTDTFDTTVSTSEDVASFPLAVGPLDMVSVSGTDCTIFDGTPTVLAS